MELLTAHGPNGTNVAELGIGTNEKARQRNVAVRSELRTNMRKVREAIASGDKEAAVEAFKTATPQIDRAANKGLIHANKAARHKSRLKARVHAMP